MKTFWKFTSRGGPDLASIVFDFEIFSNCSHEPVSLFFRLSFWPGADRFTRATLVAPGSPGEASSVCSKMPMHQGAPPPGRLTVNDVESRQGQAWDEMMHVQVEETIQQFVDEMQIEMEGSILSDYMTAELRRLRRRPPTRPSGLQISETRTSRYNTVRDQEYGRASRCRADWAQTMIWEHVGPEDVLANPDREFENLTRLPKAKFDEIVLKAATSGRFRASIYEPVAHEPGVKLGRYAKCTTPLAVRILSCLRHLATGDSWNSIQYATHIDAETLRCFYHKFMPWFVDTYYQEWVTGPSGIGFSCVDEVEASEKMFRRLGLPGIVTSMDGVHCAWDKAFHAIKWQFVGKEGFATVGWNVHILANGKICYIAPPQPGATNDKTYLRHDALIAAMRFDSLFTDRSWRVHTQDGSTANLPGCSSLCDNGYHQWDCCMAGYKWPLNQADTKWACRMESVRKNVERVFGQMKMRFRVLKVPFLYTQKQPLDKIDRDFKACAILHNMLQHAHNLDTIGQYESDWTKLAPDMQRARARLREINGDDRGIMTGHQAHHPDRCLGGAPVPTEIDAGFERRRQAMVSHFCAVTHPDFDDGSNPMDVALWLKPAAECRTNTTYGEEE